MNRPVLTIVILLLSQFSFGQDSLLVVEYERRKMETGDLQKYIRYTIDERRLKIDFLDDLESTPNVSRIVDLDKAKVTALFPRQSLAIDGVLKGLDQDLLLKTTSSLKPETKSILGKECNLLEQSFEGSRIVSWISQEIPLDYNLLVTAVLGVYEVLLPPGIKALPLEWEIIEQGKPGTFRTKVLRIEKIPFNEDQFEVPEGYQFYKR